MWLRRLALVLPLFLNVICVAKVRLGPEVPILPLPAQLQPAAFAQHEPSIATNGRDFLAAWSDRRDGDIPALYVARLDDEGRPSPPMGRKLDVHGFGQKVASNGSDYLIVWSSGLENGLLSQRIDRDGQPIGERRHLSTATYATAEALASNGTTYLAVVFGIAYPEDTRWMVLLDSDGAALRWLPFGDSSVQSLTVRDGRYYAISTETRGDRATTLLRVIDDAGSVETRVLTEMNANRYQPDVVATSGDINLVAGQEAPYGFDAYQQRSSWYAITESNGGPVFPIRLDVPQSVFPRQALWDGREFLLLLDEVFPIGDSPLYAVRISRTGIVQNDPPYLLSQTTSWGNVAFASNGNKRLLLWSDTLFTKDGDIITQAVRDFASLATSPRGSRITSLAGAAQISLQGAAAGKHQMFVWTNDTHTKIFGAASGVEITVAEPEGREAGAPSIAAGSRCFLVAWREGVRGDVTRATRLVARRYAFDGAPLDVEPLVLIPEVEPADESQSAISGGLGDHPAIAARESTFMVAITDPDSIRSFEIDAATGSFKTFQERLSSPRPYRVRVLDAGGEWLMPFTASFPDRGYGMTFTRVPPAPTLAPAWFIDRWDVSLPFGTTFANGRATIAWRQRTSLFLFQTAPNGSRLDSGYATDRHRAVEEIALEWDGSEYVLAWTEEEWAAGKTWLQAMRLTSDLQPLDDAPFLVAENVTFFSRPTIVPTEDGVMIGYSRSDEEHGNVPRAFTRTLARIAH